MRVAALAGGVGAGKFLRGLVRAADPGRLTVIVNTGDDLVLYGLHVSPDLDSVTYWLADAADRDRGWGRRNETFHAMETLRTLGADAWFSLGDRDLATHLLRTGLLQDGATLTEATDAVRGAFGIDCRVLPMSDDPVATRIDAAGDRGEPLDLHFQEYWVRRGARDPVKGVRYEGAAAARPAPGVLDALAEADIAVICPSNPVASIHPILAVPGIRGALDPERTVAVTPIVRGAPLAGMADRLMPAIGLEVSAFGAASAYEGVAGSFVVDERDGDQVPRIRERLGMHVGTADTIMTDDRAAERLAIATLELAR